MNILEEIYKRKRDDLAGVMSRVPERRLALEIEDLPPPISLKDAIRDPGKPAPRLIAEIKRRSPSKGQFAADVEPASYARTYSANGASAISILTEESYFAGSLDDLALVSELGLSLPLLRKDFIFDQYQLFESRRAGASGVLLIAGMLEPMQLNELVSAAKNLELTAVVEIHTFEELQVAVQAGADVVGVNNRDLHNFHVDLQTSFNLRPDIPEGILTISESGIKSREDAERLGEIGFDAVLVGERLMTSQDPAGATRELSGMVVPRTKKLS